MHFLLSECHCFRKYLTICHLLYNKINDTKLNIELCNSVTFLSVTQVSDMFLGHCKT